MPRPVIGCDSRAAATMASIRSIECCARPRPFFERHAGSCVTRPFLDPVPEYSFMSGGRMYLSIIEGPKMGGDRLLDRRLGVQLLGHGQNFFGWDAEALREQLRDVAVDGAQLAFLAVLVYYATSRHRR